MYILVLPVSGGGFVSQLAIIQHLCSVKYRPDIVLASSGGNLAAYIAAAADWKWPSIERISMELNSKLFAQPWSSISILSLIKGYFNGNINDQGTGIKDLLHKYFDADTIKNYEIWTGTYNRERKRSRLFCNRDSSILDTTIIDKDLTQTMDPVFMNGDIDLINKASVASASIPAIVPAQLIDEEYYIDGGISNASPLSIMTDPIIKLIRENNKPLHINYVTSVDLTTTTIKPCNNVVDTLEQATSDLVRGQTVCDRVSAYELLRFFPGNMNKDEFPCTYDNLLRINNIRKSTKYSLLEIYPYKRYQVDIINFNGKDVIRGIKNIYGECGCRFWWLKPDDRKCYVNITSILQECKSSNPQSFSY